MYCYEHLKFGISIHLRKLRSMIRYNSEVREVINYHKKVRFKIDGPVEDQWTGIKFFDKNTKAEDFKYHKYYRGH